MDQIHLSAVAYERDGVWIVQGIEHDIRARTPNKEDVRDAILIAVHERIALDRHLGRKPLEGVGRAPAKFVEMFAKAGACIAQDGGEVEIRLVA